MISYRCPDCGSDDEHFHHSRTAAPASIECRGTRVVEQARQKIERQIVDPTTGTVTIEYEEIETAPQLAVCTGTAVQRDSLPGEIFSRPARGFEALVIYERAGYDSFTPEQKRSLQKYYVPGRNYEPTEPGMKRIEITNMAQYNRLVREVNRHEIAKMSDHREMHKTYFDARRKALRDDVNARVGPQRSHPLVAYLRNAMRKRSDRKSIDRYGKPLDARFHAQLLEFNQGNMQDFCDKDTGWRATRAK
jgi:hypothetical protein